MNVVTVKFLHSKNCTKEYSSKDSDRKHFKIVAFANIMCMIAVIIFVLPLEYLW